MMKRLNNKGFVFIETIITSVILLTALVLLYNSFSNVIVHERQRVYYDDITYVHQTMIIKDILNRSLDMDVFETNISTNSKYIYFFNVNSPIYLSNKEIEVARRFFNFYQLAHINISDIIELKSCLKASNTSPDAKCSETRSFINTYAYTNFKDYLLSLDVSQDGDGTYQGHKGILISIFYFMKNGDLISDDITSTAFNKYGICIQNNINKFYADNYYNYSTGVIDSADEQKEAKRLYNANKDLNFSIRCSNAYYYSWVYL